MILQGQLQGVATSSDISILDLMLSSSAAGMFIIAILILLLGVSVYIYVERSYFIKNTKESNSYLILHLEQYVSMEDEVSVAEVCEDSEALLSEMILKIVKGKTHSYEYLTKSIEDVVAVQVYNLERNVNLLATIAGVGPMIGFLGTVIGMILSFHDISVSGGDADMGIIANGIYTAMTTTVVGLVVGIASSLAYNHMVMKIEALLHSMQLVVMDFLDNFHKEHEV